MNRVYPLFALVLTLSLAVGSLAATTSTTTKKKQPNPLDAKTMKVALHTATAEEGGFIDMVLAKVDDGTLPLDLVQSTFLWAKKKPYRKFQYFKYGLLLRAAQRGISL
jgi:hypothetical protein